ncbi:CsbD family protein, partial [Rhodococcoides yunnanense]
MCDLDHIMHTCTSGGGPRLSNQYQPRTRKGTHMSFIDKAKNAAEDAIGKAKEVVGDATNNKDLEAEGKKDQGSAGVKKVGEN